MKGVIIYDSLYGATKTYATWISLKLNLVMKTISEITNLELTSYDYFIFGTPVYFGKMTLSDWITKHAHFLKGKQVFLFFVGGTPSNDSVKIEQILEKSLPRSITNTIKLYYLPGRMKFADLSFKHKLIIRTVSLFSKNGYGEENVPGDFDNVKDENLTMMLREVQTYCSPKTATA